MPRRRLSIRLLVGVALAVLVVGLTEATDNQSRKERDPVVILKQGTSESGASWELRYRETERGDCLELSVDEAEPHIACGFDIPNTTEVGFGGGLKPGEGDFFLYGLTSTRVTSIVAESPDHGSEVQTEALPSEAQRPALRFFVLVRDPVDNVDALVALDRDRGLVQRLELPKALE